MSVSSSATTPSPKPYATFDGQFIGGAWRAGRSGQTYKDFDPYSDATIAEIALADRSDLDEAYQSAAAAQPEWAAMMPAERAAIMRRAADIMDARREEIIDWLIRE